VWNLVADIAGGKEAEGVWEYGVDGNISTEEGRGNGGMEEIAERGAKMIFYTSPNIVRVIK